MAGRDRDQTSTGASRQADVRPVEWGRGPAREQPAPWVARGPTEASVTAWTATERVAVRPSPVSPPPVPPAPSSAGPSTPEPAPHGHAEPPPEVVSGPYAQPIPEGMLLVSEEALAEREDAIVEALRKPYLDAARSMLQAVDELETRLTDDVVDLAARIAQALTYREFTTDKSLVLEVAQRALRLVGPLERLTVRCAPEDAELLRDNLPGLARVEVGRAVEVVVRPSDDILPGGLLLTFDGGVVDAREERRAARIVEAVKAAIREARQDQVSESTPASAGAETEVKS